MKERAWIYSELGEMDSYQETGWTFSHFDAQSGRLVAAMWRDLDAAELEQLWQDHGDPGA